MRYAERRARHMKEEMDRKVDRLLNFLASMPGLGHTTVPTKVVRALLLKTDGQIMARGRLWEITAKSLGAGVYRVSTKASDS